MCSIDWTAVNAIAMVVYTIAFGISVCVLLGQLKASQKASHTSAFAVVSGMLRSPMVAKGREMIFVQQREKPDTRFNGLVENIDGRPYASRMEVAAAVCRTYDDIAAMVENDMLPRVLVMNTWGREVKAVWPIVAEFVAHERGRLKDEELWKRFERLATT